MKKKTAITIGVAVLVVAGGTALALMPEAVDVDTARVEVGTIVESVDEEGKTRVRERFDVSSPLAGKLERIEVEPGDHVKREQVLARLVPVEPPLMDAYALREANARLRAAQSSLDVREAALDRAKRAAEHTRGEADRAARLFASKSLARAELDDANYRRDAAKDEVELADEARRVAMFELEVARAAVARLTHPTTGAQQDRAWPIRAPLSGRVISVAHESEGVIAPGTRLLTLADPAQLEVTTDVVTRDAVRIKRGARVIIDGIGDGRTLDGAVKLVEPGAFTKVSPLGVEEQRARVVIELRGKPESWKGLGDGYRVDTHVHVGEAKGVVLASESALFRTDGGRWAAFVVEGGRAVQRELEVGITHGGRAEIRSGLSAGDEIVLYPSGRVHSGARLSVRASLN